MGGWVSRAQKRWRAKGGVGWIRKYAWVSGGGGDCEAGCGPTLHRCRPTRSSAGQQCHPWVAAAWVCRVGWRAMLRNRAPSSFVFAKPITHASVGARGRPDSFDLLKKITSYNNMSGDASHPVATMFWNVMDGFTNEERAQVMAFTWGRRRLPPQVPVLRGLCASRKTCRGMLCSAGETMERFNDESLPDAASRTPAAAAAVRQGRSPVRPVGVERIVPRRRRERGIM